MWYNPVITASKDVFLFALKGTKNGMITHEAGSDQIRSDHVGEPVHATDRPDRAHDRRARRRRRRDLGVELRREGARAMLAVLWQWRGLQLQLLGWEQRVLLLLGLLLLPWR